MMTIVITVNQPRPDWDGMNVKRFVYLRDFHYFRTYPEGIWINNLNIPSSELSNVSIMYPK